MDDAALPNAPRLDDDLEAGLFTTKLFAPDLAESRLGPETPAGRSRVRATRSRAWSSSAALPASPYPFRWPQCAVHWTFLRGLFRREIGRRQGEQRVDARLLAYLSVRRYGSLVQLTGLERTSADPLDMEILIADTIRQFARADSLYTQDIAHLLLGPWPANAATAEQMGRLTGARRPSCTQMRVTCNSSRS